MGNMTPAGLSVQLAPMCATQVDRPAAAQLLYFSTAPWRGETRGDSSPETLLATKAVIVCGIDARKGWVWSATAEAHGVDMIAAGLHHVDLNAGGRDASGDEQLAYHFHLLRLEVVVAGDLAVCDAMDTDA